MTVFDDLEAEQDRLADILAGLSGAQWATPSLAPGWTVRDVVVHLAQGEELAVARLGGTPHPAAPDPAPDQEDQESQDELAHLVTGTPPDPVVQPRLRLVVAHSRSPARGSRASRLHAGAGRG